MCRPNTCDKCKKRSFKRCGQHLKTLFKTSVNVLIF